MFSVLFKWNYKRLLLAVGTVGAAIACFAIVLIWASYRHGLTQKEHVIELVNADYHNEILPISLVDDNQLSPHGSYILAMRQTLLGLSSSQEGELEVLITSMINQLDGLWLVESATEYVNRDADTLESSLVELKGQIENLLQVNQRLHEENKLQLGFSMDIPLKAVLQTLEAHQQGTSRQPEALKGLSRSSNELKEQLSKSKQHFTVQYEQQLSQEKQMAIILTTLVLVISTVLFFLLMMQWKLRQKEKVQLQYLSNLLEAHSHIEKDKNTSDIDQLASLIKLVMKANSHKIELLNETEIENDKLQSLASFLGYEIHALTSIVAGGLSINDDVDNDSKNVFSSEINIALESLEQLSDNFISVFSHNKQSLDEKIIIRDQIKRVVVLLNAKCRALNKEIDFYVTPAVPESTLGNNYRFYWCLYNVLVRLVEQVGPRKFTLIVDCDSTALDKVKLSVTLLPVKDELTALDTLRHQFHHDSEQGTGKFDDSFYSKLVSNFFTGGVVFKPLHDESIAAEISFELVATARLEALSTEPTENVIVCGEPCLEREILLLKLQDTGLNYEVVSSLHQLMKRIASGAGYSCVVLMDGFKGVNMATMLKGVTGRTQGKTVFVSRRNELSEELSERLTAVWHYPIYHDDIAALSEFIRSQGASEISAKPAGTKEERFVEKQLLVVDDDPSQQFILSRMLKRIGANVKVVNSGESAIDEWQENNYDIIFMDCLMPGMSGIEATQSIRDKERTMQQTGQLSRKVVIIGNTALTTQEEINECLNSGMDNVLLKPYKYETIFNMISRYA
ncbi:response regulator [Photobacterium minamisatsumaniensis]|uniref:response regulator n=1 Tax=Photobacterium minamisatsumaniensis TaxID=2910233 RepID=UPI003D0F9228